MPKSIPRLTLHNFLFKSIFSPTTLNPNPKQTSNKLKSTTSPPTSKPPLLSTHLIHNWDKTFLLIFNDCFNIGNHQNGVLAIYSFCAIVNFSFKAPMNFALQQWRKYISVKNHNVTNFTNIIYIKWTIIWPPQSIISTSKLPYFVHW